MKKEENKKGYRMIVGGLLILLIVLLIFTSYKVWQIVNRETTGVIDDSKPLLPVCFFIENEARFNEMLPYINALEPSSVKGTTTYVESNQANKFYINIEGVSKVTYSLLLADTQEIIVADELQGSDLETKDKGTYFKMDYKELEEEKDYVLVLKAEVLGQMLHYYQNIAVNEITTEEIIEKIYSKHQIGFSQNNENENRPKVEVERYYFYPNNNGYKVEVRYTLANKKGHEFKYSNIIENYSVNIKTGEITVDIVDTNNMWKPEYDEVLGGWVIANESSEGAIMSKSHNNRYGAFEIGGQLWFYDETNNDLALIDTQGILDGDYYIDESREYHYVISYISNKGKVIYMKYGYQGDGPYRGMNGIELCVFDYFEEKNNSIAFIPSGGHYLTYREIIGNALEYNEKSNRGLLKYDDKIYAIDFEEMTVRSVLEKEKYRKYYANGYTFYDNPNNKGVYNISYENLFDNSEAERYLDFNGYNIKVLEVFEEGILVGKYHVDKVYESVDTTSFYPYEVISFVDFDGQEYRSYEAGEQLFYGDFVVGEEKGFEVGIFDFNWNRFVTEYDDLQYRKIKLVQFEIGTIVKDKAPVKLEMTRINGEEKNSVFIKNAIKPRHHNEVITYEKNVVEQLVNSGISFVGYEMYDDKTLVKRSRYIEELMIGNYERYTLKHCDVQGRKRVLLEPALTAESHIAESTKGVVDVSNPLSASAMLLNMEGIEGYKSSVLENMIIKDIAQGEEIDGLPHCGDRHQGYVFGNNDICTGTYIEPLYEMFAGMEEVETPVVIKNIDFEKVKYFIDNDEPVLVIYSEQQRPVKKDKHVVKTQNGFMELVNDQRYTVIVGYDNENIYYYGNTGNVEPIEIEKMMDKLKVLGGQGIIILK